MLQIFNFFMSFAILLFVLGRWGALLVFGIFIGISNFESWFCEGKIRGRETGQALLFMVIAFLVIFFPEIKENPFFIMDIIHTHPLIFQFLKDIATMIGIVLAGLFIYRLSN